MAYSEFSLDGVKTQFKLRIEEDREFFAATSPVEPSALLRETLAENIPLATAISTEKAHSELIIAPVLVEVRRQTQRKISLFSGVEFNVDPEQGLNGTCDFLLSLSPEQLLIEAPAVVVVEAKNDNLKAGLAQCLAEMVAARLFNQRKGKPLYHVFGVVTTGSLWKFMSLAGDTISLDVREYHISETSRIVGILLGMVQTADSLLPGEV